MSKISPTPQLQDGKKEGAGAYFCGAAALKAGAAPASFFSSSTDTCQGALATGAGASAFGSAGGSAGAARHSSVSCRLREHLPASSGESGPHLALQGALAGALEAPQQAGLPEMVVAQELLQTPVAGLAAPEGEQQASSVLRVPCAEPVRPTAAVVAEGAAEGTALQRGLGEEALRTAAREASGAASAAPTARVGAGTARQGGSEAVGCHREAPVRSVGAALAPACAELQDQLCWLS